MDMMHKALYFTNIPNANMYILSTSIQVLESSNIVGRTRVIRTSQPRSYRFDDIRVLAWSRREKKELVPVNPTHRNTREAEDRRQTTAHSS